MIVPVYLLAAGTGWVVAQASKYALGAFKTGRWKDTSSLLHSGNMPSVHTSTTVSLAAFIGIRDGVDSAVFMISFLLAAIVAYDAMGVRRAAGEQGLALRELIKSGSKKPHLALGHLPSEVAVGGVIGLVCGLAVAFFTSTI